MHKLAIKNNSLRMAVNRIYYAMYYIVSALALKYKFKNLKHQPLIGWFISTFINKNIVDRKYGEMLSEAFKQRSEGDYGTFVTFNKKEVLELFDEMKEFTKKIKQLTLNID
ncbi:MAG: HEPN domain-containing protein [Bacteroidetes bacterium]|nr:HEPN domain-containing protein [Bacteroidota bacterium]